mmetsp:Transcript_126856/g.370919  ORF Transcript_126856/g.370919 Transcript_126856/m.370919 type:complete len:276 (+) Transcript_126856:680-1507(+)
MQSDIKPVPQSLQWRIVIVICREEVGHQCPVCVHRKAVVCGALDNLPVQDHLLLYFPSLNSPNARVITLFVLKPCDVLRLKAESHEAHLHITMESVLYLVQDAVEVILVIGLAIGECKKQKRSIFRPATCLIVGQNSRKGPSHWGATSRAPCEQGRKTFVRIPELIQEVNLPSHPKDLEDLFPLSQVILEQRPARICGQEWAIFEHCQTLRPEGALAEDPVHAFARPPTTSPGPALACHARSHRARVVGNDPDVNIVDEECHHITRQHGCMTSRL